MNALLILVAVLSIISFVIVGIDKGIAIIKAESKHQKDQRKKGIKSKHTVKKVIVLLASIAFAISFADIDNAEAIRIISAIIAVFFFMAIVIPRISEVVILLLTLVGGFIGTLIGMKVWNHKTGKKTMGFRIMVWIATLISIVIYFLLFKEGVFHV